MQIADAIKELAQGNVIAIPTETVYGLAADATNKSAIHTIFALKKRPSDNPLIVHVWSKELIKKYVKNISEIEALLIDKLMPGPLTILLPKNELIPYIVTAGSDLVAIRIPNHPLTQKILEKSGMALAAPSANISGQPSPTTAEMVYDNFGNQIHIVDGWPCTVGIESTVIQVVDQKVLIHRPWFITPDDIQSVVWDSISVQYSNTNENISPWVKYKHYSPKAKVYLLKSGMMIPTGSNNIALLVTDEWIKSNTCDLEQSLCRIYRRWSHDNLLDCAQNLYQLYHKADKENIQKIYVEELLEEGIGYAIMNRVRKSLSQ